MTGRDGLFGSPERAGASLRGDAGLRIELLPNRIYVLGREASCDIQLDDGGCSRRHAKIIVTGNADAVFVEDLDSKNGTYRNGRGLKRRTQLKTTKASLQGLPQVSLLSLRWRPTTPNDAQRRPVTPNDAQ